MKKSCFFVFLAFLFIVSCSNGDEPLIPCLTVSDCPDSSYSCFDGFCVHAGAVIDPSAPDSDTTSDDTLPEGDKNDGDSSSENGESNNDDDSTLPDSGKPDNDGNSESQSDKDSAETSDSDGKEGNDSDPSLTDNENSDDTDTAENGESDSSPDDENTNDGDTDENGGESSENHGDPATTCGQDSDCAGNLNRTRCNGGTCVICLSNDDCDTALGQNCDLTTHECVSNATCAAAIAKLPHGGKFDWEDGTSQGFSDSAAYTYPYWDVVPAASLPAEVEPVLTHGGNYSFGKYTNVTSEKYKSNTDQVSALSSTDLTQCSECKVKAKFYVRGKSWTTSCSNDTKDYLNPTCKGSGSSSWVEDGVNSFITKICSYSEAKWTEMEWTVPESCKTEDFVFGLRFRSDIMVEGPGLFVDNLTIAPAATEFFPNGAFESATNGYIKGWACDLDSKNKNVLVKVEYYKNNDESVVSAERWVYAKLLRPDDPVLQIQCDETYNHGFEVPFDSTLMTVLGAGTHSAAVFAVDIPSADTHCAGTYTKLGETKEFEIGGLDPKKQ